MKVDTAKEILAKRPFKPLVLRMVSGEEHRIVHPEQAAVFPDLRLVVIGGTEPGFQILEAEHIEAIRPASPRRSSRPARK